MKTTTIWVVAGIIVLGGIWYFWPKQVAAPEATPTRTPTSDVGATPSPTPTATPKKNPTPTPTRTPTPTGVGATEPTLTSVTPYQTSTDPAGWWIRIVGTLANGCMQLTGPSFSRDGTTFLISLPVQSVGQVCTQMVRQFIQTINIAPASLEPGLYTVSVNGQQWTSFIIPTPTPTPTPSPLY